MKTFPLKYCVAVFAVLVVQSIFSPQLFSAGGAPAFKISPQEIEITSFYHGATLRIEGTVPSHSDVAVLLIGEEETHTLQRKDRVGPFWMNVDTVSVEGAPTMYYLATTTVAEESIASFETLADYHIGYNALKEMITIQQAHSESPTSLFPEFIKLKEHTGLYRRFPHVIRLEPSIEGWANFAFSLPIPPLVPPGELKLEMHCFKEGQPVLSESSELLVRKAGMPEKLSNLAFDHGALYGICAIAAAIAAGLIMGLIFGKKEQGGH